MVVPVSDPAHRGTAKVLASAAQHPLPESRSTSHARQLSPLQLVVRYWETVRWLRPEQLYIRLWRRVHRPNIPATAPPLRRGLSGHWVSPARRRASVTASHCFCYLNELGDLRVDGWDNPRRDKLWRYNQHYFDDLNAAAAFERTEWHRALLTDWLAHNYPAQGTGWEPYPTSLRIVNWIKWALSGSSLDPPLVESLATQTRWLSRRLEWHLRGNHLFANAKALIFAGLWFDGREAHAWLNEGFSVLERETEEQILPDGGQFELSPMYHALALEDLLDLVNICTAYDRALTQTQKLLRDRWISLIPVMSRWLDALSHPDGEIAFFNDAAMGIAPPRVELRRYSNRLGVGEPSALEPVEWLSHTGYARLSVPDALVVADMARVGPDYLPGHAHADTLSFELSVFGQRLLVNSGASVYGKGPERQRQRSTSAHNTVVIADRSSSDVWNGFRVGRRARPFAVSAGRDGDVHFAQGSHDGYKNLPGHPIHTRRWELSKTKLRVVDHVSAPHSSALARFHVHPDVALTQYNEACGKLVLKDDRSVLWRTTGGPAHVEQTSWHPEFGKNVANSCIVLPLTSGSSVLELIWGAE